MSAKPSVVSKKAPKDLNAPKRPPSSYLLFTGERRDAIKAGNPSMKVTEISKAIGLEWGALGDAGKQPYIKKAGELKAEWEKAMAEYKQTQAWSDHQQKLAVWKQARNEADRYAAAHPSSKPLKSFTWQGQKYKEPKKPKDIKAPKKPQTAYFIFSNERRPSLKEIHPEWKVTQFAKQLGQDWAALTPEVKQRYTDAAAKAKAAYALVYEEYKKSADYAEYMERFKQYNNDLKEYKSAMKAFQRDQQRRLSVSNHRSSHDHHRRHDDSSSDSYSDSDDDSSSGSGSESSSGSGSSSEYSSSD